MRTVALKTLFTQTRLPTVEVCDMKETLRAMRFVFV